MIITKKLISLLSKRDYDSIAYPDEFYWGDWGTTILNTALTPFKDLCKKFTIDCVFMSVSFDKNWAYSGAFSSLQLGRGMDAKALIFAQPLLKVYQ